MGVISDALNNIRAIVPARMQSVGAAIPTWQDNVPQYPRQPFYRYALEGYGSNEIVYACVEELSTSAAEPRLAAYTVNAKGKPETVSNHPLIELFERPNPFMSRYQFVASLIMYRSVAGNAYVEKVRSASGAVVQLWPLRPDRMFVIPDEQKHIRGWEYRLGEQTYFLPAEDVIQTRTRNPLDDWYGLPPIAVIAPRVDTDNFMRAFTGSFFRNAGVPAGLLNITKQVSAAEKEAIKHRFGAATGGPGGWHSLLVLDNMGQVDYKPMGLPLGGQGIILPELDEIDEARLAMVFGVPLELIGARLSMLHGNRTTMKEARATFWDETLSPQYQELGSDLSLGLVDEPWGVECDYIDFDLSTVRALQEDEDSKHNRIRSDVAAGIISIQEARAKYGEEPEFDAKAILMIPDTVNPLRAQDAINPPAPESIPATPKPSSNGNGHGKPVDMAALKELAAGR